mgnify:CR=1 FL=1
MNSTPNKLKLGIPKGSLEEATISLFARSGWKIRSHSRNYFPEINDPEIAVSLARAQEIPRYVSDGVLDVGLSGKDWIMENKADVEVVANLIYSKVSSRTARWVLAVAGDSPYHKPEDLNGKRIATEIMGVTSDFFAQRGIDCHLRQRPGAGLVRRIWQIVEAGGVVSVGACEVG